MTPETPTPETPDTAKKHTGEDTNYRSIRYHCPACSFAFDIGGFIPEEKLPQEPILLCPKCNGPALRVTAEQSRQLRQFVELREQATALFLERMEQAGYYKRAENIRQNLSFSKTQNKTNRKTCQTTGTA